MRRARTPAVEKIRPITVIEVDTTVDFIFTFVQILPVNYN